MTKVELLAPAGDQESLIAAVQNGADAIYLGGTVFNARAYAKNFDHEQLKWAVEYAHFRNVKIYVTVNTLYKDEEISELINYIDYLYDIQVDALIVQDIGLFDIIKARYSDFEIHMSTQASLMNAAGAQYFEKQGASRVVLARENNLEEIRNICQSTSLEVEVFVHGALCICYSGQCLMSSMIGKRSGNRGACAQPCRLQYRILKDGKAQKQETPFLLSPKDLMSIYHIGELINAGVTSFKIEGRMKKPEYVASVVKAYRKAIDAHLHQQSISYTNDINDMKSMFNRDYTDGYIANDRYIVKGDYSGNKGTVIGNVIHYNARKKTVLCQLTQSLNQGDSIVFESIDKGRPVNKMYINQQLVAQADAGDTVEIEFDFPVRKGLIRKTIDKKLCIQMKKTYDKEFKKIPVYMTLKAYLGEKPKLILSDGKTKVSIKGSSVIEKALHVSLSKDRIIQQLSKLGNSHFFAEKIEIDMDENITIPIKILNEMRRNVVDQLIKEISYQKIHHFEKKNLITLQTRQRKNQQQFYVLVSSLEQLKAIKSYPVGMIFYPYQSDTMQAYQICQENQLEMALFIPRICKDIDLYEIHHSSIYQKVKYIVVNDYGAYQLFQEKSCIIGTGLNVYNSYALHHYQENSVILSLEISQKELNHLQCDYQKTIIQIYGKVENMISEYCPISQYYFGYQKKHCQLCRKYHFALLDRKNEVFDLFMDEKCRMHLLNCRTLFIEPHLASLAGNLFIHFTNEDSETIQIVMDDLLLCLQKNSKSLIKDEMMTTMGYFKK